MSHYVQSEDCEIIAQYYINMVMLQLNTQNQNIYTNGNDKKKFFKLYKTCVMTNKEFTLK